MSFNSIKALLVVPIILIASMSDCIAADDSANVLARRIFAIDLEMQKLNYHLHLEAANPSFKRARRTWLWDIGNGLCTEGGLISATSIFWKHVQDKTFQQKSVQVVDGRVVMKTETKRMHNQINGRLVAGTLYPQIVGQAIGGAGSLYELSRDITSRANLRKELLDDQAVTKKMVANNQEAENLLEQLKVFDAQYATTGAPHIQLAILA